MVLMVSTGGSCLLRMDHRPKAVSVRGPDWTPVWTPYGVLPFWAGKADAMARRGLFVVVVVVGDGMGRGRVKDNSDRAQAGIRINRGKSERDGNENWEFD